MRKKDMQEQISVKNTVIKHSTRHSWGYIFAYLQNRRSLFF